MGKVAKYMDYKSLREEQNLAVKGILSGRDVFVIVSHAPDSFCFRVLVSEC